MYIEDNDMERNIENPTEILEKHKWSFKPCPFCGSTDIGVKDTIVDMIAGEGPCAARKKIWAYCRYCEATSGYTVADIIGDDEEIAAVVHKWNKRM